MTKPAWRRRYDETNPRVTIRLTASLKKILDELRKDSALSYADLIKRGLETTGDEMTAYQRGWSEAEELYAIRVPCSRCGVGVIMEPGSKMHKVALNLLKDWQHTKCPKKPD